MRPRSVRGVLRNRTEVYGRGIWVGGAKPTTVDDTGDWTSRRIYYAA